MPGTNERIRVLHVGDDPSITFEDADFHVTTAGTAATALDQLATTPVDCVVADVALPDAEGLDLLEAVRSEYGDLPFVVFTATGSEALASEAIAAGVDGYHRKGVDALDDVVATVRRVVERHRYHGALTTGDRRLSWFFEQSPLGVIEWNDEFRIQRVNAATERILGYDESELRGERWSAIVPEMGRDSVSEVLDQLADAQGGYHSVNENLTADGTRITCEWYNRAVTDESGRTVAVFSQFQDITERIERQRTLQQLHEVSRDLLTVDAKTDVADLIIEAVRDTLGYDNNAVRFVSDDGTELHIAARTDGIDEVLGDRPVYRVGEGTAGRAFAAGETLLYDDVRTIDDGFDRGNARAGMYLPIGDHGTLSINGTTVGAFDESDVQLAEVFAANAAVALDLIERTRQLERQNERLDEFASVVSHDLQNPLNVAIGRAELAREECDTDHLDAVVRAHERMQELTQDLLELARDDGGDATMEPIALADAVEACWQHVDTCDATLVVETDGTVVATRSRLQQLLENLVRNAVEHGGDDVTVTVGDTDDGFFVADDGRGIPEGDCESVLEAGYSTAPGGTGIGLSIVERIAAEHGWTVEVTESADGGARFDFGVVDG